MPGLSSPVDAAGPGTATSPAGGAWPVTFTTTDGVRLDVECAPDRDVLAAAADAGYVLPSLCRNGSCGACVATVNGAHDLGPHSDAALPPAQRQAGSALLCCTYPTGPLDVALRCVDARVIRGTVPQRDATLVAVEPVSPDGRTVRVRLRLGEDAVSGAGVEFEPGQFVEVALPGEDTRRAYSLSSVANWDGEVELLIRLREGGWFSTWLSAQAAHAAQAAHTGPGAALVVHGPQGAFGLQENGIRPRWFVAGGTGLAPMLSMVRRMAEWGDPQPVRLYLGVTTEAELPDLPELAEALDALPGARYVPCVWRPADGWTGAVGAPVDAVVADLAARDGAPWPDVYVCGPPALVDAVTERAREAGLPEAHLVVERFVPA